jgi:hypothetical protein
MTTIIGSLGHPNGTYIFMLTIPPGGTKMEL